MKGGKKSPSINKVRATKYVVSRKTPVKAMPTKKSNMSAFAPNKTDPQMNKACTAKRGVRILDRLEKFWNEQSMYRKEGGKLENSQAGYDDKKTHYEGVSCGTICQEMKPLDEYVEGTCYTECGESQLVNDGRHQKYLKMAEHLIKNCKDQTEHRGKTCHDGEPLDEQSACNKDSYLRPCEACKKTHCECTTSPTEKDSKPPDMSLIRDCSQLKFYTSALEKWATTATDGESSEEHGDDTCSQNWEGSQTENMGSCREACVKKEDSCSGCCNVGKEAQGKCRCPHRHYTTIKVEETKAELQLIDKPLKTLLPNRARDASPPMDTPTASVSKIYDAQSELELVLQEETEATSQVSQSIKQLANSNLLHGMPDPQPLIPTLDTTDDGKKKARMEEMSKEDPIRMKDRRLHLPINQEYSGHLQPQFHSPNPMLSAHLHQNQHHGHPDATKEEERKTKTLEHRGMTCQDTEPLGEHVKCTCYIDC